MTYQLEVEDKPVEDKPVEGLMTKFRSRKWRLTLLVLLTVIVFAGVELLSDNLTKLLIVILGSYTGVQGLIDWQQMKNKA